MGVKLRVLNQIENSVLLLIVSFFLTNCTTLRSNDSSGVEKNVAKIWSLSTKYYDKKKKKKYPGITKVIIDQSKEGLNKLRLDVYGPLGFVHVGTLIINNDQIFIKTMSGERFEGEATPEGVARVLRVPIEPMDLFSLFTQEGFADKTWMCTQNENNVLSECRHRPYDIMVQWSGLMNQSGTKLELEHPRAEVRFKVKSYTEKSNLDQALFSF